jgi:release factor glutamine methyltransferase
LSRRKAINLQGWRGRLQDKFQEGGIDEPHNTSLLLLAAALDHPKTWILSHREYEPTTQEIQQIQNLVKRVAEGMPLPYVLGQWEFFGRPFRVTPDVLIPRPETEILVEIAVSLARDLKQPKVIDVGTGCGAIAISLAAELPKAKVIATDISLAALKIARENARRLGQPQLRFLQADLLRPFNTDFDLICANLPYIPTNKLQNLGVARWEPRQALDGGKSGLKAISALLHQSRKHLMPNGVILLEIESSLGPASLSAAKAAFPEAQIKLIQDLSGRDRIIKIVTS